jgi:putative heme iron utilization protein
MARLDDLNVLREQLQAWLEEAPVDRKAALVAQYRATIAEIAELAPEEAKGDGIDEIAARRSARRAGPAKGSGRSKRSG